MRSYRSNRSGNTKVKKILFRILFVILAAVIITVLTVLLGHHLLDLANSLEDVEKKPPQATTEVADEPDDEIVITSTRAPSVFAATVDVRAFESEEEMVEKINSLSYHYDTLILPLYSEDGGLIYQSPAICKMLGIPALTEDEALSRVISAVAAASVRNMRLCAVIPSSYGGSASASASVIDGALIAELATFGFDEVMISCDLGYTEKMSQDSASDLRDYLTECAENSMPTMMIGITLPAEVFLEASNAKQIQIIGSAVSFLGIDFSTAGMTTSAEIFSSVSHDITSLLGSFTTYNMRHIISNGDTAAMAAEYTACVQNNMQNVCIMAPLLPEELNYDQNATVEPEETDAETTPAETQSPTNPYASTADSYPEGQKPAETDPQESEPEETDKPWY